MMATNNPNINNGVEDPDPEAAAPDAQPEEEAAEAPPTIPESRLPTKKDTSLREFLGKMDDYAPIVRLTPTFYPGPLTL